MQLRPYQTSAIKAIEDEFILGTKSTLLVMPTGSGKTVVMSRLASASAARTRKKVLFLAHRTELIDQLVDACSAVGLHARIEKAEERAADRHCHAVVASVQSISRASRLERFVPEEFGMLFTDEAHHATAASYRAVYEHFKGVPHLGVTATPSRHDEVGLKNVYESVAFQYTLQQAIKDGWLAPIRGEQIRVEGIHLEDIKIVAGDFSQSEMDEMLRQEATLQGMVVPTIERSGERPTIVFTPGVEHAYEIAKCFNRLKPGSAAAVDGGMDRDDRAETFDLFKRGKIQYLVNVNIATEGFDHPPVSCIALFRPTKSLGLFAQMVGRGTRLFEGKTDCLVLDFVGVRNSVRTITVMDVLDGTKLKDAEHDVAQELQDQGLDAIDALEQAKQFVANQDAVKIKMKALSTANAFDVLQLFAIPNCKGLYGGDPATMKQIEFLQGKGIKTPAGLEKGEASELIGRLVKRQGAGLATFKQIKYLKRLGYQDNFIDELSFDAASEKINSLVNGKNGRN